MKKHVKIIAIAAALVLIALCLVGCGSNKGTIEKIKENGKFTVLTEAGFAPFEYIDKDGEIAGVDVEISQRIADKLGVELEMVSMDFDGLIQALQAGKGDMVAAGLTADEERAKSVDFSINYIDTGLYIIVKGEGSKVASKEDIAEGVTVGVQKGTTSDLFVSDTTAEVSRYTRVADAVVAVQTGKIDAVVCDELPATDAVTNNPDLKLLDDPLTVEQYSVAVTKGDEEFLKLVNEVLQEMLDSGEIDELVSEHMELAKQAETTTEE